MFNMEMQYTYISSITLNKSPLQLPSLLLAVGKNLIEVFTWLATHNFLIDSVMCGLDCRYERQVLHFLHTNKICSMNAVLSNLTPNKLTSENGF